MTQTSQPSRRSTLPNLNNAPSSHEVGISPGQTNLNRCSVRVSGKTQTEKSGADQEQRKARTTTQLAKRIEKPELTVEYFKEETANLLAGLESTINSYQASEGINLPLVEARDRVQRLTVELNAAKAVLEAEEQKGSLLDRLRKGVQNAKKSLSGLVGSFSALVVEQLVVERFGRKVAYVNLGADTKRELRYHIRVASLSEYLPHVSAGVRDNDGEEKLFKRANDVANKLDAFKQHVEQEAH